MRILMVHTEYKLRGGEDESTALEIAMLRARGHRVDTYIRDNGELDGLSQLRIAAGAVWNPAAYRTMRERIRTARPDIVHVQNSFPLLSPSVIWAARRAGVPVVQSLRNYRLLCLNATMFRNGKPCERCVGHVPAPGVRFQCYRDSRAGSAVVASMLVTHRILGTWTRAVSRFVATSEFTKSKYVQGGFESDRVAVKPNMLDPDPGAGGGDGDFVLFVGRLSHEKGLGSLLSAWRAAPRRMSLVIIGDGPLAPIIQAAADSGDRIQWLGKRSLVETIEAMGRARALIVPSEWHEPFGRVVVEAYAKGTPVIASRMGGLPELVKDGETGWLFDAGDTSRLASIIESVESATSLSMMRQAARAAYLAEFTAQRNYTRLIDIYRDAITDSPHSQESTDV